MQVDEHFISSGTNQFLLLFNDSFRCNQEINYKNVYNIIHFTKVVKNNPYLLG